MYKKYLEKMKNLGIKAKLIIIFIIIKVIPVIFLAWIAWSQILNLSDAIKKSNLEMIDITKGKVEEVGKIAIDDSIRALDNRSQEAIEQMTTATALEVAKFLYSIDNDLLLAADLPVTEEAYYAFLRNRKRDVYESDGWVVAEDGKSWLLKDNGEKKTEENIYTKVADNEKNWHYRKPENLGKKVSKPLYLQLTFVDLNGNELIKINTADYLSNELKNISNKSNTYCKAEDYFAELLKLQQGEIYVSDVIGPYIGTPIIGPYTPMKAKEKNIAFEPEKAAYAGKENPVGKKFKGLVRWATPVVRNGNVIGYLTIALDHLHLIEFTEHIVPTDERYAQASDAAAGNYAFIWDYKGRSIVHPRHHSIVGYDPQTGEPVVPWLDTETYAAWKDSGLDIATFLSKTPEFNQPSLKKKPSTELTKAGLVGLDGRYLNFAPQCAGWHELTQNGGSGSFTIFWTGLWKLTTAATIPYYTGKYAKNKRGFGYVTIGANVDDFHKPAQETANSINNFIEGFLKEINGRQQNIQELIVKTVRNTVFNLTLSTLVMVLIVVFIAVWMAAFITKKITIIIEGLRKFRGGQLETRLSVNSKDEVGELSLSFNEMAQSLQENILQLEIAKEKAEVAHKLKNEFLQNISHELKTPLNSIIGFSDVLQVELTDNSEQAEYAEIINNNGKHLHGLLKDILEVSRIEKGDVEYSYQKEDVKKFVNEVVSMYQSLAKDKGLSLKLIIDENLPVKILTDGTRIQQILRILLSNALKFTDAGEVTVNVSYKNEELILSVSDTGKGIMQENSTLIFEMFRQGESFLNKNHAGLGVGLALLKKIVEGMAGRVWFDSKLGCGTVFFVALPERR